MHQNRPDLPELARHHVATARARGLELDEERRASIEASAAAFERLHELSDAAAAAGDDGAAEQHATDAAGFAWDALYVARGVLPPDPRGTLPARTT